MAGIQAPAIDHIPAVHVLGVRVHRVGMEEAVALVRRLLTSNGTHQIATVNGGMLVRAVHDESLRRVLNHAALVTPDGAGVLLAGRILGQRFPERVAGVDLVGALCAACAQEGFRVYLFGGSPGVAKAAADVLQARFPGLEICGAGHGYFDHTEEPQVLHRIRAARPHLLLVGLGSPRQEEWIATHRESLGATVSMGVGGTFDVLAGRIRRAPRWMQRIGLEWAYRLVREPGRWRVAVTLPLIVWLALKERLSRGGTESREADTRG